MYKRLLFAIMAGGFLVGGTACYKEVMDMDTEPLRPEYVLPAVYEKLTVEKLLSREAESTTFEYEPDGTCVAVYREKRELGVRGMSPHVTTIPSMTSGDINITNTTDRVEFKTLWNVLPERNVKEAFFDTKSKKFGVTIWYEHTVAGSTSEMLQGNIMLAGVSKGFRVKLDEHFFIDLKQEITAPTASIYMKDGSNYNILSYVFESLKLLGSTNNNIRIYAQLTFEDLYLRRAVGHKPIATTPAPEKTNIHYKLDIFSTIQNAKFTVPEASIRFTANKAKELPVSLYVGKIFAKPAAGRTDLVGSGVENGVEIQNKDLTSLTEEQRAKALLITSNPATPQENSLGTETQKVLELNQDNSNISAAFDNGMLTIDVNDVYISQPTIPASTEDKDLPLDGLVDLNIEVRLPFYGTITRAEMTQDLKSTVDAFPNKYLQYLQNPGNPEEVKDAVVLHIAFLNSLPLEGYAKIDFMDAANTSIMSLRLNNSKELDGRSMLIPCGEVSNGRVIKPAFIEHLCNLSKGEYEKIAKNVKYVRASYIFDTPDAAQNKNIRIMKDDAVLLQMAVEVKGYIEHPVDFIDSMSKAK